MLDWKNDTTLTVEGTDFALAPVNVRGAKAATDAGALLLRKPRWMVERYAALRTELQPANVFELGIYEGGSTALLALLLRPRRYVAVDLRPTRVQALDDLIAAKGIGDRVHAHYGVDQADRARLEAIVEEEFGSEPLDLVTDDASHLLDATTTSFNVLFPRLRPGGLFVIEDWSWQHSIEAGMAARLRDDEAARTEFTRQLAAGEAVDEKVDPISRLVLQIVLTSAFAGNVVAEAMSACKGWFVARRGDAVLDPNDFDIRNHYGALGRRLLGEPEQ